MAILILVMLILVLLVVILILISKLGKEKNLNTKLKGELNEKIPDTDDGKRTNLNKYGNECDQPD